MTELEGEFKPDYRMEILIDRLEEYYVDTSNSNNKYAIERWKAFKDWAQGYTQEEINLAKKCFR